MPRGLTEEVVASIRRVVALQLWQLGAIKVNLKRPFRLTSGNFSPIYINCRQLISAPAFADVIRGNLRLLLSGPASSAGRPMPDGSQPVPGGWNRIHLIVDDLAAEVARLRAAGVQFRNDVVAGPGGSQVLLKDPSGNLVELFQPARR